MRIAIALGDPNGIGPEIAVKAAQRFEGDRNIQPLLVGDGFVVEDVAHRLGLAATPAFVDAPALETAAYRPGTLDPRAGRATVAYAATAVKLALEGKVDAVIGCPHSETAVNRAGIAFNGYPGLVADLLLSQRRHDIYLAMFHDQGHIPIKLLSPLRASALTIGTPIVFASVAHGCAYDIAGKGVADETGMVETVEMLTGSGLI